MLEVKVKYFNGAEKLKKLTVGNWIDLRANQNITLYEGEHAMIPLGIAMELPEGYEAVVVPRSSSFKNYGFIQTNHIGVIDNSYCGDNDQWYLPIYCLQGRSGYDDEQSRSFTVINRGDRVCQFRIQKVQPEINFVEVEHLGNKDRGGFGSTGVK